jgi:transposase-like protein
MHDISLLKTQHETELSMFKTKCKQDIKDYEDYLKSLDQLKRSLQASFTHLPEAVAFTIHHHAKYLLHKMWEADDYEQKMLTEMQLITFMTTVHEDSRAYLEGKTISQLPENTLRLLERL